VIELGVDQIGDSHVLKTRVRVVRTRDPFCPDGKAAAPATALQSNCVAAAPDRPMALVLRVKP
jgi:hypothetical protein